MTVTLILIKGTGKLPKKNLSLYMSQGLGNQLFFYTYILNLIEKYINEDLRITIFFNRKFKPGREFILKELIELDSSIIKFQYNTGIKYLSKAMILKIVETDEKLTFFKIFKEKNIFEFEQRLLKLPNNSFVMGSFISNRYVDNVFPLLQSKLTEGLNIYNIPKILAYLDNPDVLILHIRRGDTVGKISESRGLLTSVYYQNAIDIIEFKSGVKFNHIIAVTDDIETSQKVLTNIPISKWLGPQDLNAIEALKVFINARNFIGANSTLSWWGVRLSKDFGDSYKILPRPWLGFRESDADKALFFSSIQYVDAC
jgi:hypothetical protein